MADTTTEAAPLIAGAAVADFISSLAAESNEALLFRGPKDER